jgi:hypothetical protein
MQSTPRTLVGRRLNVWPATTRRGCWPKLTELLRLD